MRKAPLVCYGQEQRPIFEIQVIPVVIYESVYGTVAPLSDERSDYCNQHREDDKCLTIVGSPVRLSEKWE